MSDIGKNYPSNSHKAKEKSAPKPAKQKVEKITTGEVIQRKKPLGSRISEMFTGEDMRSVGSYLLMDVGIPALKNMLSDLVSQGVERWLFGESRPRSSSGYGRSRYTSYDKMHSSRLVSRDEPRALSSRARATHDFGEIILETRVEAEEAIDKLRLMIDQYDVTTVSDLYDMVGITGEFTDDKWGWTDLRHAGTRRVRDGYLLELPRPEPID